MSKRRFFPKLLNLFKKRGKKIVLRPPVAEVIPTEIQKHDDTRIDDYFWLRNKEDPRVIAYLKEENAYTEAVLESEAQFRELLFRELKSRIQEKDFTVPYEENGYFYYSRIGSGQQYWVDCRKKIGTIHEETLLDLNSMAKPGEFWDLGVFEVSPNGRYLAYSLDRDGSEKFELYIKDLEEGTVFPHTVPNTYESFAWANDSKTFYYNVVNDNLRPYRVCRLKIGQSAELAQVVYEEQDPQFFVSCHKSKNGEFIFIDTDGSITSEVYYLSANSESDIPHLIRARVRGVEYAVMAHEKRFFILTNENAKNFRIVEIPIADVSQPFKDVVAHRAGCLIDDVEIFKDYLVLFLREKGIHQIEVIPLNGEKLYRIPFFEPSYCLSSAENEVWDSKILRFDYSSLKTPNSVFDFDLVQKKRELKKQSQIPGGKRAFNSDDFITEMIYAKSQDGTEVPVSLVYRKEVALDGSAPCYLYGYGSYGLSRDPSFSISRLALLDRGFVFAMAHIRGGSDLGREWYEDGKFLKKKNTFLDFIAAAECLLEHNYTSTDKLTICGGSAGGMLIGACINMRPELYRIAIAHVPFVDVLNTMLDETLPLTPIEYDEWGNPNDPVYYHYIKSYSPYDNVEKKPYPHLMVFAGLNDPRVTYWEPAKWVAKLRANKTDQNFLCLNIQMGAGHGGATGRYDYLKEVAMEYVFIFKVLGITE